MIGRRSATAVCLFFVVRANSNKTPKCGLGAQWATAKKHLGDGEKPIRGEAGLIF